MDYSQKRLLRTLLSILTVLVVLVITVSAVKRFRASRAEEAAAKQAADGILTPQSVYTALSYSNGTTTLSFTAAGEDGAWQWADDPDFPLDDATVTAIASLLQGLTPQQTITDGDALSAYGLEEPFASLTATGADGSTLTLELGNATTDGSSYYMLMNGDESTVYIIADTLYQQMSKPIYDMMRLPSLPVLTADTLQSITVEGAALTTLTAARSEDSQETAVTWRSGGANVTDNDTVSALVADLETLTLAKCVDYRPSQDAAAICGFDAPDAVVTVVYTGESGAESTWILTVGSQVMDGTGRYVRLNDDSAIYQINTDGLDALMPLAAAGLEG